MGSSFYQDTGIDKDQVKTAAEVAAAQVAIATEQAAIATSAAADASAAAGAAESSQSDATASANAAAASELASATSEANAATSAATATTKAGEASTSASDAASSAATSTTQAAIATTKAGEADASADAAALSEVNAATSAADAATSEANAAASATSAASEVSDAIAALTKGDVGLDQVDNTSDANKPVSTAQATALALKIDKSTFDASDQVLVSSGASSPTKVTLTASTVLGRAASGSIAALTSSQVRTVLGLATTDKPVFDGIGVGSAVNTGWGGAYKIAQIGANGAAYSDGSEVALTNNCYFDGTNWKRIATGIAQRLVVIGGAFYVQWAASGAAGSTISTWSTSSQHGMNGVLSVGESAPSSTAPGIHIHGAAWVGRAVDEGRLDLCANVYYDGSTWRLMRTAPGASAIILSAQDLNGAITFYRVLGGSAGAASTFSAQFSITSSGILPGQDNVFNFGNASTRWTTLYATTGSINTSDARHKEWRGGLNEQELAVAKRISGKLGIYRWLSAVAEKGPDARLHAGVLAQEVRDAFIAEGLDGFRYGLLCYDEWDESTDPNSGEITQAGNRYAVRYEELTCFMLAAFEARLSSLESVQ